MNNASNTADFVRVDNVVKHYGAAVALRSVSLTVDKGQAVALIGPSGSGKSTLLRCINALETTSSGTIRVDGVEIGYEAGASGLTGSVKLDSQHSAKMSAWSSRASTCFRT